MIDKSSTAARTARRFVQHTLGDDAAVELLRDAILLTSELVTNATMHTDNGCRLIVQFDPKRAFVRVEVEDNSTKLPEAPLIAPPGAVGGLGLRLVGNVASKWGATPSDTGKTVWFELTG
jgi:two-component sensor histidine kinase